MPATPYQIISGRKLLGLTIIQLSESAGVGRQTLQRVEAGKSTQMLTRVVLQKALEDAGVEFLLDGKVTIRPAQANGYQQHQSP